MRPLSRSSTRSYPAARAKAAAKQTAHGEPVRSQRTLLADPGMLTKNEAVLPRAEEHHFFVLSQPTPFQQRALDLPGLPLKAEPEGGKSICSHLPAAKEVAAFLWSKAWSRKRLTKNH
ncbi:MAG: hypothetical protein Kow00109_24540 [Acidobacteriota bacterium]